MSEELEAGLLENGERVERQKSEGFRNSDTCLGGSLRALVLLVSVQMLHQVVNDALPYHF